MVKFITLLFLTTTFIGTAAHQGNSIPNMDGGQLEKEAEAIIDNLTAKVKEFKTSNPHATNTIEELEELLDEADKIKSLNDARYNFTLLVKHFCDNQLRFLRVKAKRIIAAYKVRAAVDDLVNAGKNNGATPEHNQNHQGQSTGLDKQHDNKDISGDELEKEVAEAIAEIQDDIEQFKKSNPNANDTTKELERILQAAQRIKALNDARHHFMSAMKFVNDAELKDLENMLQGVIATSKIQDAVNGLVNAGANN